MTERAKRPTRKELRQPDEFLTLSRRTVEWGRENPQVLLYAGAALLAVLLIAGGVSWYVERREARAAQEYYVGIELFHQQQWEEALTEFSDLAKTLGNTVFGRLGRVYAGRAATQAGKPELAIEFYREYLADGPDAPALEQLSRIDLAGALEKTGDAAGAKQELERALALEGPAKPEAILALARIAEASGDSARALELYERYMKDDPTGALRNFARDRVVALGGKPAAEPAFPPGFRPPEVRVQ